MNFDIDEVPSYSISSLYSECRLSLELYWNLLLVVLLYTEGLTASGFAEL